MNRTRLLFIVIVVVLDVDHSFACAFECPTAPGADSFVYSLFHMSNVRISSDGVDNVLQEMSQHLLQ
jgi:hypothetical protein